MNYMAEIFYRKKNIDIILEARAIDYGKNWLEFAKIDKDIKNRMMTTIK